MAIPELNSQEFCEQVDLTEQAGLNSGTSRLPEEVLVPDVRNGLTPAQMVDQKLQAMLGSQYQDQGISHQQIGRSGTISRMGGK